MTVLRGGPRLAKARSGAAAKAQCDAFSCAGTSTPCFFFQSPMAALMASSASPEQWIFTGGSESSRAMSVVLVESAPSTVFPFPHSGLRDEVAEGKPHQEGFLLPSFLTPVSGITFI